MKNAPLCLTVILLCAMRPAGAYTVKTYHGTGTTKIEACSLAKAGAESPSEESAHGRMLKMSHCKCAQGRPASWQCMVQTTHER